MSGLANHPSFCTSFQIPNFLFAYEFMYLLMAFPVSIATFFGSAGFNQSTPNVNLAVTCDLSVPMETTTPKSQQ